MTRRELVATILALSLVGGTARAADPRLALKGYDPVAYFTDGKPTPGKPEFETTFDAARYRFASMRHMELFNVSPDRYLPQFGGSCAMALSAGVRIEAEPSNWLIVDGKLFLFASSDGLAQMQANSQAIAVQATENWKKAGKASN